MNIHAKEFTEGGRKYVRLPAVEYHRLVEAVANTLDVRDVRAAKKRIEGGETTVPASLAHKLMDAETPGDRLRIWRESRGMSKTELANAAELQVQYIGMIESGKRGGTTAILSRMAKALDCTVDDLL